MDNNIYRWVKASERLPDDGLLIFFRTQIHQLTDTYFQFVGYYHDEGKCFIRTDTIDNSDRERKIQAVEWLEKVEADQQAALQDIKEILIDSWVVETVIKKIESKYHLIPK